ncbi:GDP-mannose-dependent alpha-(1-6)-phosphatidylinositol monomannoside mannosyltransferase [Weissella viridescens]|uniref:GDP-mannose-dependent alpha-(1-6)-phosphatidylinositol monomannoside mannosyltransferase n=1 Tax=Weissella viridescens TaxID=1629 RepID=A0A380NXA6_WEIVI|nr:GDP-mannose-dependent alpha-(1-6)-phosphatidylinositol monomannoside mannosyltransferase [Weissella viridescens]
MRVAHKPEEDYSQDLYKQLGLTPKTPIVMSIGRVAFEKNIDDVITAFAQVVERIPEAKLVIVGDGPARSALESQASDLGIRESVILWVRYNTRKSIVIIDLVMFCLSINF